MPVQISVIRRRLSKNVFTNDVMVNGELWVSAVGDNCVADIITRVKSRFG